MKEDRTEADDKVIEAVIGFRDKSKDYEEAARSLIPRIIEDLMDRYADILDGVQREKKRKLLESYVADKDRIEQEVRKFGQKDYCIPSVEEYEKQNQSHFRLGFLDILNNEEAFSAVKGDDNLLFYPRMYEMIAQHNLNWIEMVGRIDFQCRSVEERGAIKDRLNDTLWCFIYTGEYYEKLGMIPEAHCVWKRTYLACRNIAIHEHVEPLTKGLLYETMGICKILLEEKGVHECFKISYEILFKEHKRRVAADRARRIALGVRGLTAKVVEGPMGPIILPKEQIQHIAEEHFGAATVYDILTDAQVEYLYAQEEEDGGIGIAWDELEVSEEHLPAVKKILENEMKRKGIEWVFIEPSYTLVHTNEAIFHTRLNPQPPFKEVYGDYTLIWQNFSLERTRFYLKHTEGM